MKIFILVLSLLSFYGCNKKNVNQSLPKVIENGHPKVDYKGPFFSFNALSNGNYNLIVESISSSENGPSLDSNSPLYCNHIYYIRFTTDLPDLGLDEFGDPIFDHIIIKLSDGSEHAVLTGGTEPLTSVIQYQCGNGYYEALKNYNQNGGTHPSVTYNATLNSSGEQISGGLTAWPQIDPLLETVNAITLRDSSNNILMPGANLKCDEVYTVTTSLRSAASFLDANATDVVNLLSWNPGNPPNEYFKMIDSSGEVSFDVTPSCLNVGDEFHLRFFRESTVGPRLTLIDPSHNFPNFQIIYNIVL